MLHFNFDSERQVELYFESDIVQNRIKIAQLTEYLSMK